MELESCVRFLFCNALPVTLNVFGFLFHDGNRRIAGGWRGRGSLPATSSLLGDGFIMLQRQNEVGRRRSVVRSAKNLILVAFERGNPGANVGRMLLGIVGDSSLRRQENAREFRPKFFPGIVHVPKTIGFCERRAVEP